MEQTIIQEETRIKALGFICIGIMFLGDMVITVSRDPGNNDYCVDIDRNTVHRGKYVPEWARLFPVEGAYNQHEYGVLKRA